MKNNIFRKVKAFTLSEMIVVLVITMIVVGLAYSVLNLVQKQMNGIAQNYEQKTDVNSLRQALWVDFSTYGNIRYDALEGAFFFENEMETIKYNIEKDKVIRNLDTIPLAIQGKKLYFNGKDVTSGEIDALQLITVNGTLEIFVYKNNTAATYLKL